MMTFAANEKSTRASHRSQYVSAPALPLASPDCVELACARTSCASLSCSTFAFMMRFYRFASPSG